MVEIVHDAVDAHAHVASAPERIEFLLVAAPATAHDRGQDFDQRVFRKREHALRHLLGGLARNRSSAAGTVGLAGPRVEQAQVVGDFSRRADGGAGIAADVLLLDRDGGRQAVDGLDLGTRHLVEVLPRVGGERFDVAALSFGVERVERERRLAGARETGDDHELVSRNLDVEVAEVVLASSADDDLEARVACFVKRPCDGTH